MTAPASWPTSWKEKLPGVLVALAVQSAILAALIYSLVVPHMPAKPAQEIIFMLPPAPTPAPMVIDARRPRPASEMPPAVATTNLPAVRGSSGITALPQTAPQAAPQPAPTAPVMQNLGRAQDCRPDDRGRPSPRCPAPGTPAGPATAFDPNPPSTVKDEERWAKEKRGGGGELVEVAPGVSVGPVGPGVGAVITDPLCRMAKLLLAGGFTCGFAPPPSNQYSDAQFKAALAATNKRRGVKTPAALASAPAGENGHEKDRTTGNGAGAGAGRTDTSPGPER